MGIADNCSLVMKEREMFAVIIVKMGCPFSTEMQSQELT